jgi:cell wall assembly regulator SMI1
MSWQDIAWEDCRGELGDAEVGTVEQALGVTFPEDYRACVKKCHGGRPRDNNFSFLDPALGRMESALAVLLSFSDDDVENIVETHRRLLPFLPHGVIPIADDGGGDFVCFQYAGQAQPSVVYWHHGEPSVVPLSESFSGFLETLYAESPEFLPRPTK